MKIFLPLAGLLASSSAVLAHDSAVPHTHSFDQNHSDLFVWSMAGLVLLAGGVWFFRAWRRHRAAAPVRGRLGLNDSKTRASNR